MRFRILFLLLFVSVQIFGQNTFFKSVFRDRDETAATPTESITFINQFTSGGSPKDFVGFISADTVGKSLPVIVFLHGDGGKGTATYTTAVSLSGSGTGPYTGNFVNTTTVEVAAGSVEIFDNGSLVARGKTDGTLLALNDSGVSGTIAHTSTNGAVSVTFPSTPAGAVTMDYAKSAVFETGLPMYLNGGDLPTDVIILCPQMNVTDFDPDDDWSDLITYAKATFPNIDSTRFYLTGLSRGGRGGRIVFQAKYAEIAACYFATMDYIDFNTDDWTLYDDRGFWVHHGTSDGTLSPNGMLSMLNNSSQIGMNIPPIGTPYWGVGHSATIWNTNAYNRAERTDATGTADHDWIRWIKKFSLDSAKRAELFVENAEYTEDIVDYREAYYQVDNIGAGALKTSLLSRLATVKTAADKSGVRYIIDPGATTTSLILPETTGTNVNSMTNFNASQSISNLVGEDKSTSTIGFAVNTEASSTPTNRVGTLSNRIEKRYFGYPESINQDGARILNAVSGEWEFNNLPDNTYDLRIYYSNNDGNFSSESSITISVGGDAKTAYAAVNGYRYLEWTGLSRDGSNKIIMSTSNSGGTFSHVVSFELLKY